MKYAFVPKPQAEKLRKFLTRHKIYGEGCVPKAKADLIGFPTTNWVLIESEFPDAKFIYLIRNPFETIPSLLKLIHTIWNQFGMDPKIRVDATRVLAEGCMENYTYAMEVLSELPEERYAIVEYEDLVADPKATVEKVYQRLGLSISPDFEAHLSKERSRQKRYHSTNVYSLEEFGLSEAKLSEELADIIERFGFSPETVPKDQTREML